MKKAILLSVITLCMVSLGCAKKKSSGAPAPSDSAVSTIVTGSEPFTPNGSGPGQGPGESWEYGGYAPLNLQSINRLMEYTQQARNNPQDVRINLNLTHRGGDRYGGTVTISYTDNGQYYEGYFTSGESSSDNKYNIWFEKSGKTVYHGFFEDFLGAIIIVIDGLESAGDGLPPSLASGRVYFKNFDFTNAPNPLTGTLPYFGSPRTYCWFISLGPYDCRAWPTSRGVETTRAINPDNGYKLLGSFNSLILDDAFNGEL